MLSAYAFRNEKLSLEVVKKSHHQENPRAMPLISSPTMNET
jgi:hypothetical protein